MGLLYLCPYLSLFLFPLSVSFHQRSTLILIYMLLSPEGQMGDAWEPSKKQCSFGIGERWIDKHVHTLSSSLL